MLARKAPGLRGSWETLYEGVDLLPTFLLFFETEAYFFYFYVLILVAGIMSMQIRSCYWLAMPLGRMWMPLSPTLVGTGRGFQIRKRERRKI